MQTATNNTTNARYNDEVLFLDGVKESHPEIYNKLSASDKELLKAYYLIGQPVPPNIFEYRQALVQKQPGIEIKAKAAFRTLFDLLNIDTFTYSTRPKV